MWPFFYASYYGALTAQLAKGYAYATEMGQEEAYTAEILGAKDDIEVLFKNGTVIQVK